MGSIIEAPQLGYLKLKSPRQKDRVDVIELIKADIDIDACRTYLTEIATPHDGRQHPTSAVAPLRPEPGANH